jgi:YD repeat-containing protein
MSFLILKTPIASSNFWTRLNVYDEAVPGAGVRLVSDGRSRRNRKTVFVYDANGRITEEEIYINGVLDERTANTNDGKGNRTGVNKLNPDGSTSGKSSISHEEFNEADNWTKLLFPNGAPSKGNRIFDATSCFIEY